MKTSPEGRPIKINDLEDLGNIQRKHEIPRDNKLYGKWGRKPNRRMRMEHSQNLYGLFVVYRYVCVDDIFINFTIVVSLQTCLRFYLVLHRFSYMFIDHFVLLKWLSNNIIFYSYYCMFFFLPSNKANLIYHLLFSKIYIDKPRLIILCRVC